VVRTGTELQHQQLRQPGARRRRPSQAGGRAQQGPPFVRSFSGIMQAIEPIGDTTRHPLDPCLSAGPLQHCTVGHAQMPSSHASS
jgi:hypothetical protein